MRGEDGNITILSIVLIATGAVLSAVAWDLNSFEHRRVGIQQIADRAVLAAADLDQTIASDVIVQDYFDKAGYGDVVSSVNVDEGLNYRTVSVDVHGLVASQVVGGSFSGEVQLSGNAGVEAPKRAAERINRNSPLDQGMSDAEILQDVIDQDFTQGGISRDESDRMAELRILLRDDSINTLNGSSNLSNSAIVNQELARLLAAENGTVDPLNYRTDEAAAIAATLTQADARQLVRMREAMAQDSANRDGNMADYTENYDLTPDQRRVLELTEATRLADLEETIQRLEDAVANIDEQIVLNGTVQDLLAEVPLNAGIEQLIGEDILGQIQKNAQDSVDPGANRQVDAQNVMDTMHERNPEYTNYHAYDLATSADWDQLNNEILADQWEESQRKNGNYLELRAFAEAEERVNNVEISLVLDISGSMGWDNKMANLRDASNTFIDAVINDSTQDLVSISVVPCAEHVSSGPAIMEELNVRQRHNYSHCVEFADADFKSTEISYRSNNSSDRYDQMQHFFWGSTNSNSRSNPACRYGTHDDIKAFSQDTWALKDKIARLSPNGNTSIFLGMKWAAGLLDPAFQPVNSRLAGRGETDPTFANRPVAFDDRETLKTVILMTDGENTSSKRINPQVYANSSHYAHWNSYNFDWYVNNYVNWQQRSLWSESKYWTSFGDQLLNNVCTAAKQNNIVIWSIGFEVSDRSAGVMQNCASSPSHFFRVEGVQIKEAFSAIARQINQLRLTQ